VENITQFCWKYSSSFQQWKNFENRLRFEKVIAKSLAASFFGTQCYTMLGYSLQWHTHLVFTELYFLWMKMPCQLYHRRLSAAEMTFRVIHNGTIQQIIFNTAMSWHFLPARRYTSAGYSDRASVRLCVCPSDTRRYCVKTKKASGMISSSGSPKTLVFRRQISSPNSKGFPPNWGLKQGSVGKIQRFSTFKRQYIENCSRYGQSYY